MVSTDGATSQLAHINPEYICYVQNKPFQDFSDDPAAPVNRMAELLSNLKLRELQNDIGTHGQVQGRLKVGVVPVGVNLRALPLRGNFRYAVCYRGGARGS